MSAPPAFLFYNDESESKIEFSGRQSKVAAAAVVEKRSWRRER